MSHFQADEDLETLVHNLPIDIVDEKDELLYEEFTIYFQNSHLNEELYLIALSKFIKNYSTSDANIEILKGIILQINSHFEIHFLALNRSLKNKITLKLSDLICEYIRSQHFSNYLVSVIQPEQSRCSSKYHSEVIQHIASLPDRLSNCKETSIVLSPRELYKICGDAILQSLETIHKSDLTEDCFEVKFISQLISKLCSRGDAGTIISMMFKSLTPKVTQDPIWSLMISQWFIQLSTLQKPTIMFYMLQIIPWYGYTTQFFGKCHQKQQQELEIVAKMFITQNKSGIDIGLQNFLGYLASDPYMFHKIFDYYLDMWSRDSVNKEGYYNVCKAVMAGLPHLKLMFASNRDLNQEYQTKMISGLQKILETKVYDMRNYGMLVGQCLSVLLSPDSNGVEFKLKMNKDLHHLKVLQEGLPPNPHLEPFLFEKYQKKFNFEISEQDENASSTDAPELDTDGFPIIEQDTSNVKPIYFRQCLEGLISDKEEEKENCLLAIENLIDNNCPGFEPIYEELLSAIVDNMSRGDDKLLQKKIHIVASFIKLNPEKAIPLLSDWFFSPMHFSYPQRNGILMSLGIASAKMSHINKIESSKEIKSESSTQSLSFYREYDDSEMQVHKEYPKGPGSTFLKYGHLILYSFLDTYKKKSIDKEKQFDLLSELLNMLTFIVSISKNSMYYNQMAQDYFEFLQPLKKRGDLALRNQIEIGQKMLAPTFIMNSDLLSEVFGQNHPFYLDVMGLQTSQLSNLNIVDIFEKNLKYT